MGGCGGGAAEFVFGFRKRKTALQALVLEGGFYLLLVLYNNTLLKANSNLPSGGLSFPICHMKKGFVV